MRYKIVLLSITLTTLLSPLSLISQEAKVSSSFYMNNKGKGTILVSYEIPEGLHQIDNRTFFTFSQKDESTFSLGEIQYPPARSYGDFDGYERTVVLQASLSSPSKGNLPESISLKASYQLCDETGTCFRPVTVELDSFRSENSLLNDNDSRGSLWLFLLFAFLGGVILNIMPCVLPVLSLKALHLVGQSGDSRRKILLNSLSYAGGILASMAALAVIVIIIKASGTALGWGFQFQNPLFVLILASLVFLFSLSLFEVYFINPPQKAGQAAAGSHGGYGGSFFTGVMAVLLATPCTAPLLGSALGFAFMQPGWLILIFFILIGLGLALPFILLGLNPGLVNKLPKPGEWMNRFREVMGFLLAGTAVYLLSVLQRQLGGNFSGILWFFLILALSAWLFGLGQRRGKRSRFILYGAAFLSAAAGFLLFVNLAPGDNGSSGYSSDGDWIEFSPEKVEEIRMKGEPLFLEFSADWCATCRSNHLAVLDRDFRKTLFEEKEIVYMKGDFTLPDPVINEWLQKFHRAGVPLYVYYPPGGEPVVLPEILTRALLEDAIREN